MIADSKKQNGTSVYKKHHQRGTLIDIRGPLKKSGAGNGNWGVVGDEINTMEYNYMITVGVEIVIKLYGKPMVYLKDT
ncbi:unnamed protein product [Rhizophagus irregularis]|uniref:Uncharacterized protein n=1 Tax=Rhizophagus irregularis TaxID=588596 RepID=A0A915ZKD9_9GLOM|nr:unnamed protein product [Rhizophagus irregularis]CAB5189564.1 unnamed protein product [Rhizophagus irregularis]CAB5380909.1 unnamed protein product [Rhizophagus irregularis]